MDLLRGLRTKKYLLRLLSSIMLVMTALLLISSSVLYYYSEQRAIQIQYNANKKVLHQVSYNIDYMSEITRNLAISLFFDPDAINLMHTKELEPFELYPKLFRLDKLVSSNAYLHSIMIYNARNGCYYASSSSAACSKDDLLESMDTYLEKERYSPPKMQLVPFYKRGSEKGESIQFFSLFMYESSRVEEKERSMLIINVKPEWLVNQIGTLNELTESTGSLFIINDKGQVLIADPKQRLLLNGMDQEIYRQIQLRNEQFGNLEYGSGTNKQMVTYTPSTFNDWTIVAVQPYDDVIGEIRQMRTISMIIIVFFLLLSILLSVYMSYKLYRPVRTTLNQVLRDGLDEGGGEAAIDAKDELSFIALHYSRALEGIKVLKRQQVVKEDTLKTFFLRKLIMDSSSVSAEELSEYMDNGRLSIGLDEGLVVAILKLDDYEQLVSRCSNDELRLYRFAIGNIAGEIVSRQFQSEVVDLRGDHLAMIVSAKEQQVNETLADLLKEAQSMVKSFYNLTFSVAIAVGAADYRSLSQLYGKALEYVEYRVLYGAASLILPEMIRANLDCSDFSFPEEKGRKLGEAIKANDVSASSAIVEELFAEMRKLRYDHILHWLLQMMALIGNAIREVNAHSLQQISFDLVDFNQKVMREETLESKQRVFHHILTELNESRAGSSEEQHYALLTETIKDYMEDHYPDVNLSLQSIATMMKMSTGHVSRIFRGIEGTSVNEYLNDVRLRHAVKLLEHHSISVNEIVDRVGFGTQSYFYRLFKRKYGTTPKEYRLKKTIDE